jgi:hypothetical protein
MTKAEAIRAMLDGETVVSPWKIAEAPMRFAGSGFRYEHGGWASIQNHPDTGWILAPKPRKVVPWWVAVEHMFKGGTAWHGGCQCGPCSGYFSIWPEELDATWEIEA